MSTPRPRKSGVFGRICHLRHLTGARARAGRSGLELILCAGAKSRSSGAVTWQAPRRPRGDGHGGALVVRGELMQRVLCVVIVMSIWMAGLGWTYPTYAAWGRPPGCRGAGGEMRHMGMVHIDQARRDSARQQDASKHEAHSKLVFHLLHPQSIRPLSVSVIDDDLHPAAIMSGSATRVACSSP